MNYNYHTHTYRCHHASGTPEEYIKRAIECGITHMGFSDHVPFKFPDGFEAGYRVSEAEAESYVSEIATLREKYRDKIDIKIGFEMEYYPDYFKEMLNNAVKFGGEYLILGQHFLKPENLGGPSSVEKNESIEDLKKYVSLVTEAIKSGAYTYVAHPDIFNFAGDISDYNEEMKKICIAAKECNVPLEMNFLGIRTCRRYPRDEFWQIVGEIGSPVTFGFDAHDAQNAFDGESLGKAKQLVEKYKLNYIGMPEIVKIG